MKPWSRRKHLRTRGASAESSSPLLGGPQSVCLTSLFLPCRVQWRVISTGWEPAPSSSLLCPTLNVSLRLCFIQGLAKCRGEKTWEGVWHGARCCVSRFRTIRWHSRLIGEQHRTEGLRAQLPLSSCTRFIYGVSSFLCVFVCLFFITPKEIPNKQAVLTPWWGLAVSAPWLSYQKIWEQQVRS